MVLPGRHGRYGEVSRKLHEVFEVFTPLIEPIALDEAFLDVSGSHKLFGTSEEIADAIRARVLADLKLSCSVGVARCKLLAKLASRAAKPVASPSGPRAGPGVFVVRPDEELEFLHPRPVSDLWGVGPRTTERLGRYGIATIRDLAAIDPSHLAGLVGRAAAAQLHDLAWARDDRPVVPDRPVKSVSHEETFATDVHDPSNCASRSFAWPTLFTVDFVQTTSKAGPSRSSCDMAISRRSRGRIRSSAPSNPRPSS